MTLDEGLLRQVREAEARWAQAQQDAERAKADYHRGHRELEAPQEGRSAC